MVIADTIDPEAVRRLAEGGLILHDATAGADTLRANLPSARVLIVRSRTQVNAGLISAAPHLSLIARAGVGVDNVDLAAATARGIKVTNSPLAATTSVAELTVALVLFLVRGVFPLIVSTKAGEWKRGTLGREISGRTVGFVGYGRIAREVACRLQPFGVTLIAYDPYVSAAGDATLLVPLDTLLARSDCVTLHAALTAENRHLLNAERLRKMKPGSYLVNLARGGLVDSRALLDALDNGPLAGAALDVFDPEPPTDPRLLTHPKTIPTPHVGASTFEAQARAGQDVADEVLRWKRGQKLRFLVNPEVEEAR